ncbi:unnamed protein product [Calypogeia fissa]
MDDIFKRSTMESSSTLFEKVIPVRITKCGSEDRHMDLTIRFIMGVNKLHRTSKVLQVQITSEGDPFFFYSLEVNEDDFQSLKVEQCILVDFSTFPYKFIELLEQCIVSGCNDSPRFLAILNVRTGDSTFSIVETNQFKHLSHISLCFRQGNDQTIKSYLAGRLAEFKTINLDLHEKLRRTLLSLEKALRDADKLSSEVAELKEKQTSSTIELKAECTLEIAHEKEKAMQESTELKERLEKDRKESETRLRQQADIQQERANELDKQVRTLLDTKYKLDTKVTELRTKFVAVEKDLDEKQQECERLRRENRSLDSEKHENTKQLNRHLIRLSALEQEVQDKNDLVANLTVQLDNQGSHRSALEGSWKEAQAAADLAEERASASAAEITKCYQIIEKLQLELRSMKSKVKLKGQVTSQQDTLLQEKQIAIDKGLNDIHLLRHEVDHFKTDNESLKKKTEDLQGKLDEAHELVKSNQQLVQWLNQQLTETQLAKLGQAGVSSRYIFRPPNGLSYPANNFLASRSMVDANGTGTSLSSSSSIAGNTSPTIPCKPSIPSGHSFSTAPYSSIPSSNFVSPLNLAPNANGTGPGLPNSFMTTAGSRPCCMAKLAAAAAAAATGAPSTSSATSKVHYRPAHLVKAPNIMVNGEAYSSPAQCSMGADTAGPPSWPDDTSSWMSKIGASTGVILPRSQLSYPDIHSGFNTNSGSKSNGNAYQNSGSGIDCSQIPQSRSPQSAPQSPAQTTHALPNSTRPRSPVRKLPTPIQSPRTLSPTVKIR